MKPSLRVYATEAPVATATPANQRPASPAMSQDSCRDSAAAGRRKANGKAQRGTCQVESLQVEGGESPPVRWPHPPPPRLDSFVPGGAAADQIFPPTPVFKDFRANLFLTRCERRVPNSQKPV